MPPRRVITRSSRGSDGTGTRRHRAWVRIEALSCTPLHLHPPRCSLTARHTDARARIGVRPFATFRHPTELECSAAMSAFAQLRTLPSCVLFFRPPTEVVRFPTLPNDTFDSRGETLNSVRSRQSAEPATNVRRARFNEAEQPIIPLVIVAASNPERKCFVRDSNMPTPILGKHIGHAETVLGKFLSEDGSDEFTARSAFFRSRVRQLRGAKL